MLFGCCGTYGREGSVSINGVGFVKQNLSTPPLPRAGRRVKGGPTPFGGLDFYIGSQKSSRDMISFSTNRRGLFLATFYYFPVPVSDMFCGLLLDAGVLVH